MKNDYSVIKAMSNEVFTNLEASAINSCRADLSLIEAGRQRFEEFEYPISYLMSFGFVISLDCAGRSSVFMNIFYPGCSAYACAKQFRKVCGEIAGFGGLIHCSREEAEKATGDMRGSLETKGPGGYLEVYFHSDLGVV